MSNKNDLLFMDSETCGLFGMPVLFQYAVNDGDIHLYEIWKKPVGETIDLIERMLGHTMVFFNATFDFFHLVKTYTIFSLCPHDWIPEEHIEEIALLEPEAQDGPCIKPVNCLDLMLHSRKGTYQSLMARSDIRIRKVPTPLAYALAEELEKRIEIDGIYFARTHDKDAPKWQVCDIKNREDEYDPNFKDVVLRFNPSGALKFLAEHALGYKPKAHFKDIELPRKYRPIELGYAPTALAVSKPERNWEVWKKDRRDGKRKLRGYAWPGVIKYHIEHWATNAPAREYARDDIKITRDLYRHFGSPEAGDDDSVLACMVPVVRWKGFKTDNDGIRKLLREAKERVASAPVNINKPGDVRAYIGECMDAMEKITLAESTKKANIRAVAAWEVEEDEECSKCDGEGKHDAGFCHRCGGTGTLKPVGEITSEHGDHPAAIRADELLQVKVAAKEVELYQKILRAGKFHASFVVIGTLSTRMSGADGLNAQGIKSASEVRSMFPLAPDGFMLSLGDFSAFEITLADAVYNDPDLRKALLAGKKIHALFAQCLFPGKSYEEVLESAGTSNDMYAKGKSAVFALIYGGDYNTLVKNLGISVETAQAAFEQWGKWFPKMSKARERTFNAFCSMRQPGGLGTQVVWAEPADYVESFLGFRRYFTLENMIAKELFRLANKVPKQWKDCKVKVMRRQKVQTAGGAVSSALYGAAFQIQAANQRAAANHEIQSPGGQLTKAVQRKLWDLQPAGVHPLMVMPANVHDEIICPHLPELRDKVAETIREGVESFRDRVPLIGMDWVIDGKNWSEKKEGSQMMEIRPSNSQPI